MPKYYELMVLTRREIVSIVNYNPSNLNKPNTQEEFKDGDELDEMALKGEIDTESQTVATALGVIRWLLKNDESVKGKYVFKRKK